MKIWIYIDGRQEGPYSMEELLDKPVDENTKVWFEGLAKWYPAGALAEMRPLFDGSLLADACKAPESMADAEMSDDTVSQAESVAEEPVAEEVVLEIRPAARFAPGARYVSKSRPDEPCPPTYLGWTIFLFICCCSPVSLAALVASICVSSYYNNGRIDRARKASEVTAWLIMVAIALGMIPMMLMSALSF